MAKGKRCLLCKLSSLVVERDESSPARAFHIFQGRKNFALILRKTAETCEHFSRLFCSACWFCHFASLFHPSFPSSRIRVADDRWSRQGSKKQKESLALAFRAKKSKCSVYEHLHVRYFLLFLLGLPSPPHPLQHLSLLKSMEKNVPNFKVKCKGGTDSTKFCEHTCKNPISSSSFPCFQPKTLLWWEA